MKSSKHLLQCCTSICEGDGVSPRHEKNKANHSTYDNRRLCRQVQKLSRLAIAELGLTNWDITQVKQKHNKNSLFISVAPIWPASFDECEQAITWLKQNQSRIRTIIANGINRKSVPMLHFLLAEDTGYE